MRNHQRNQFYRLASSNVYSDWLNQIDRAVAHSHDLVFPKRPEADWRGDANPHRRFAQTSLFYTIDDVAVL